MREVTEQKGERDIDKSSILMLKTEDISARAAKNKGLEVLSNIL